jgi:hypothetical protein
MEAQLKAPSPREKPLDRNPWYALWCRDYRDDLSSGIRAEDIRRYLDERTELDRLVCVLHIAGYGRSTIAGILQGGAYRVTEARVRAIIERYRRAVGKGPAE